MNLDFLSISDQLKGLELQKGTLADLKGEQKVEKVGINPNNFGNPKKQCYVNLYNTKSEKFGRAFLSARLGRLFRLGEIDQDDLLNYPMSKAINEESGQPYLLLHDEMADDVIIDVKAKAKVAKAKPTFASLRASIAGLE